MNSKATVKPTPRAPAGVTWLRALEPRMMFDGAVAATVAETAQADPAPQADSASDNQSDSTPPAAPAATSDQRQEIIFIDSNVQNYAQLINGVSEGTEVVVLDGNKDGLQQIADYLNGRSGIDAIHIVSHGSLGQITLGAVTLDQAALSEQAATLSVVGQALTDTGDIFLYGCYVGQAQQGQSFVDEFSLLTGADVAASTDMTSGGQAGGNWVLEYQTGEVVSTLDLTSIWSGYAGTLVSIPSNITIDFAGDGFVDSADHGSNVYTNGDIKITYSAANWFQDADDGQGGSAALFAGAFSGIETITIETNSGNEFDFASFFINAFGGGFASVEGFRDGASTGLQTTGTGFGQTNGSFTVLMNDAIFNNVDRVVITSNAGGFFDIFDTFVLNAVPSNAPTLTATGTNPGFTENGSPVDLFSGVTAATNDTGQNFTGAAFTVTNVSNGASEVLSIDGTSIGLTNGNSGSLANGGSYSVTVVSGTATVTLSGMSRSNAQMGTLIDNITYSNSSDNPGNSNRVVTITAITDSGSNNNTVTPNIASTVSVTPVNDAPTITATGNNPTYTENGSAVDLFSSVSINTIETGQTITSMTLTVTNLADGSDELLRIDGTDIALLNGSNGTTAGNGISYSISLVGSTATITLSSVGGLNATTAQTVVDGMGYRNSSDTPSTATRVITLTSITDNGGTANGGVDTTATSITTSVSVVAVNDAPIVTSSGGASTFTEGDGGTVIDSGLTLSDPDNATLASATVSITGNFQSGDVLSFINDGSTMGNISATYDANTGAMTLTSAGATATLAQWQAALRSVTYSNSSDAPSTASRTISFVANDGQDDSTAVTKIVSVAAVNDAPQITAPASIGVTEDIPSAITGISFSDVDAGSANVTVTLSIGSGTLSATSGGAVTVGGTASALTLTGSIANINSFIAGSNLSFTTAANATADVTLTVNINDGGNTGNGGAQSANETITLQVTAVNDAPTITAPGSIAITEDIPHALTGIAFNDVDAGSGNVTVTFSVPSGTLSATSGSGVFIGGTASALTLTGSLADINAFIAASGITFTTASNATANVTLSVTINDGGNTGSGGAQTDTTNVTLTVTAVNDAPVNSVPTAQSVDQDSALVFNSGNGNLISISDVDAGSNVVQVTLTATNGLLTLGNTAGLIFSVGSGSNDGTMTFAGSIADINNALNGLGFSPTGGYNGPAILQITTNDLGSSGSGGAQTDTDTVSITVNSLNPRITNVSAGTADSIYKVGDTITITATFSEAVTVDTTGGIPTLLLETGSVDRLATYISGSGGNTLTFIYTVQPGDLSADLNYQSTAALSLNGASIRGATANDAVLTLPSLGAANSLAGNKAIIIDGVAATISSVSVPADGTYVAGQNLDFTVNLSESVTVDTSGGTPRIAITLDTGGTVYANYLSGSGTSALVFRLTVVDGQMDSNGISLGSSIDANGSTLRDVAGNDTTTTLNTVGSTTGVLVDAVAPEVSAISLDGASPTNATSVTFTVTFTEDVSGVDINDFSLVTSGSVNATLQSLVQIDPRTYQVTVDAITGLGSLGLNLNANGTGIVDAANNAVAGAFTGQAYTIGIPTVTPDITGDPEFRANPPSPQVDISNPPLQPTLPSLPPPPTTSPLLPPPLFEAPTLGSGIPTLGNIFINQNPLAPSYIAQVFASSSDSGGNGSGIGFLGFGGGDGGVFGSSSLSGIFGKEVQQEGEQLEVFDGKKWGAGNGGGLFGAPTLGQQLHDLHETEQRQHRELALALQQIAAAQPPA